MTTVLFVEFQTKFSQADDEVRFFEMYWHRLKNILDIDSTYTESNYLIPEPPYWIMHLSSDLKRWNIDCDISCIRYGNYKITDSEAKDIKAQFDTIFNRHRPLVVSFSPLTVHYPAFQYLIGYIKKVYSETKIVVGGPHASFMPKTCLADGADIVCHGEFDLFFSGLVKELLLNASEPTTPNITYRNPKGMVVTNKLSRPGALDDLPVPDFSLFSSRGRSLPYIRIFSQRGCAMNCIFCANTIWKNSSPRYKQIRKLRSELETAIELYGKKPIFLADETFTQNWEHAKRVASLLDEYSLKWFVQTRVDRFDTPHAEFLSDKGCRLISFGVESASKNILKNIKKGFDLSKVKKACTIAKNNNLSVLTYWLVGLPGETAESAIETQRTIIDFINSNTTDLVEYFIAIPYPGTEVYDRPEHYGINIDETNWNTFTENATPCFSTESLSASEIFSLWKKGISKIGAEMEKNNVIKNLQR